VVQILIPKKNKQSAVNRRARQNKAPMRMPQLTTSVASSRVFRFYGANQAAVQRGFLLALLAVNASGSTQYWGIISSIRIKRITMMSVSGSSLQTIGLLWKGGGLARDTFISDSSTSTAAPAYISSVPPAMSNASFWSSIDSTSLTEVLFTLNPSNEEGGASPVSIVDVHVDMVLTNQEGFSITGSGSGSPTAGLLYYSYLGGPTSGAYTPVGGLTII
jgi:hypothetical protein